MKKMNVKNIVIFLLIILITVFADRIIKMAALNFLGQDIPIISGFLELSLARNAGIAFSIGLPMFIQMMIFPVLFVFGLYLIYKYYDIAQLSVCIISAFIAGGAIGNFIDRVLFGYVIDYISVSIFPVFNLADIEIVIGIFLLVVFYGKIKRV
jgi:signal peptidase II